MNQINPLHIGLLLVSIFVFILFNLNGVKSELKETKEAFAKSEKMALELGALKSIYADKQKLKKGIKRILSQGSLRAAKLKTKYNKSGVIITAKSIDTRALNSLMGKILNGAYNIAKLKIKRLSPAKASLEMEIAW